VKAIGHALGTLLWSFAVSIGLILLFLSDMILAALTLLGACMCFKLGKALEARRYERERSERLDRYCAKLKHEQAEEARKFFR